MQPTHEAAWRSCHAALHEEINRLPRDERAAVVLCDLEGVPPNKAAVQLHWTPRRLERRLQTAHARLLACMKRRGYEIPASVFVTVCLRAARPNVPSRLIEATVDVATRTRGMHATEMGDETVSNPRWRELAMPSDRAPGPLRREPSEFELPI